MNSSATTSQSAPTSSVSSVRPPLPAAAASPVPPASSSRTIHELRVLERSLIDRAINGENLAAAISAVQASIDSHLHEEEMARKARLEEEAAVKEDQDRQDNKQLERELEEMIKTGMYQGARLDHAQQLKMITLKRHVKVTGTFISGSSTLILFNIVLESYPSLVQIYKGWSKFGRAAAVAAVVGSKGPILDEVTHNELPPYTPR